jgi:hypothetical protein
MAKLCSSLGTLFGENSGNALEFIWSHRFDMDGE